LWSLRIPGTLCGFLKAIGHTGGMCFQLPAVTGFGQQNAINQAAVISPNKKICNRKGCRFSGAGYCLFNWPAPFEQPSR
jgi:hypothetical protein